MIFIAAPIKKLGPKVLIMAGKTENFARNSFSEVNFRLALALPLVLNRELGMSFADFVLAFSMIGSSLASKRGTTPREVITGSISHKSAGFKGFLNPFQSNESAQK